MSDTFGHTDICAIKVPEVFDFHIHLIQVKHAYNFSQSSDYRIVHNTDTRMFLTGRDE